MRLEGQLPDPIKIQFSFCTPPLHTFRDCWSELLIKAKPSLSQFGWFWRIGQLRQRLARLRPSVICSGVSDPSKLSRLLTTLV